METPAELPSADAVRAELNIEQEALLKRGDAGDSRAGVLLGSAGALSALALNAKTLWVLPGVLSALVAATYAARALWPRPLKTLNPEQFAKKYLPQPASVTKFEALKRRINDHTVNEEWVEQKYSKLKVAIVALTSAVVLVVVGMSVDFIMSKV